MDKSGYLVCPDSSISNDSKARSRPVDMGLKAWSTRSYNKPYYPLHGVYNQISPHDKRKKKPVPRVYNRREKGLKDRVLDILDAPVKGWELLASDAINWLNRHESVKGLFFSPAYFYGSLAYDLAKGEPLDKAVSSSLRESVEFGESTVLYIPVGVASIVSPSAWSSIVKPETYREMSRIIVSGSPRSRGELVGTLIGAWIGGKALGVAGKAVRYREVDVAPVRPSTLRAPLETPAEAIRRAFYEPETAGLFEAYTRGSLSKERLLKTLEENRGGKAGGPTRVYHATSAGIPSKFSVLEGSSPTPGLYVGPKAYPAFAVSAVVKMGVLDRLRLLGADLGKPQFLRLRVEDVVLPEKGYGKAPANASWRSRVVPGLTDVEGFLEYQGFVRRNAGRPIAVVSPEVASKLPWRGQLEVEAVIPPGAGFRETFASRLLRYKTEVSAPELRVRIRDVLEFSSREEAEAFARRSKDLVVVKGRKAYVLEGEWTGRYRRVPVRVRDFLPDEFKETPEAGGVDLFSGRRGGYVIYSLLDRSISYARDLLLRFRFSLADSRPRLHESSTGSRGSGYTGGAFGEAWRRTPEGLPPGSEGRIGPHVIFAEGEGRGTPGSTGHGHGGRGGGVSSREAGGSRGGDYTYQRVPSVIFRDIGRSEGGRVYTSGVKKRRPKRKPTRRSRLRKKGRRTKYSEILYPEAVFPLEVEF